MAKPYKFWLKNAAGFINADANGEVTLSGAADVLPTSLALATAPNGWTEVSVLGLSPEPLAVGETYKSPSGREYSDYIEFTKMTALTLWFSFPSEFAAWKMVGKLAAANNLVLVVADYDVTLHTVGKGIAVTAKATPTHDYDAGRKRWTLEITKRVPEA